MLSIFKNDFIISHVNVTHTAMLIKNNYEPQIHQFKFLLFFHKNSEITDNIHS